MSETVTNEEVDAKVEHVNDLRVALAEAEMARVNAIRAQDNVIAMKRLEAEEASLEAQLAAVDAPPPVQEDPPSSVETPTPPPVVADTAEPTSPDTPSLTSTAAWNTEGAF